MRRDLLRRLVRLEQLCQVSPEQEPLVVILPNMTAERRQLAPGERIVVDWLRNDGLLAEAIERITCDANDRGRRCASNTYNADVIREYHATCEFRQNEECRICQGRGLFENQVCP